MKQLFVALLSVISLSALAASPPATLVYDLSNDRIVNQQGADTQRPIASLSKLMTAMVVLDSTASMSEHLTINRKVGTQLPPQWLDQMC